ncbi:MAG: hypothetical protein ACNA8K_15055 [Cyclonatronaceae bacterium]
MKTIYTILASVMLVCAIQTTSFAQSTTITETFKKHFNETVQQVQKTEHADEKRLILNDSFTKMITSLDRIESLANLSEDQIVQIDNYRMGIAEKQNELNGLDGFDQILDEDLDDFSNFSQDFIEQANRTITIGATTLLLIIIILILI